MLFSCCSYAVWSLGVIISQNEFFSYPDLQIPHICADLFLGKVGIYTGAFPTPVSRQFTNRIHWNTLGQSD